ncbi:MAG: ferredoxin [Nanoarchaeota archaeon]
MKASIKLEECIGCGACEALSPGVFEIRDMKAIIKTQNIKKEQEKSVIEATENCPTKSIIIRK